MAKEKILYITHEMKPFLELTNISKNILRLSKAIQEKYFETRVLMPRFGNINERRNRLHEVIRLSGMNISVNGTDNPLIIKVASIPGAKMQVYFLDNEDYFKRKNVFTDQKGSFFRDNDERAIFFCKGSIETIKKLGWAPDIIHCHGWMSSLVPLYLKTIYKDDPIFKNTRVIYSVYSNSFSEQFNPEFVKKIIVPEISEKDVDIYAKGVCSSLYMGAMQYSDAVVKSDEILDHEVSDFIDNLSKPVYNACDKSIEEIADFYKDILNKEEEKKKEELISA